MQYYLCRHSSFTTHSGCKFDAVIGLKLCVEFDNNVEPRASVAATTTSSSTVATSNQLRNYFTISTSQQLAVYTTR
jgi:hypothetical protein